MSVNQKHPGFVEFIRNEHKTLQFLFNNAFIESNFKDLAISAKNCFDTNKYLKDKIIKQNGFKFETNFNIEIESLERRIIVEVIIDGGFSLASYVLSICEESSSPFSLLRKFHFDYAIPREDDRIRKPVYHLQYGGEQSPGLALLNVDVEPLGPGFSSPRIIHTPVNLGLLLDFIFTEFKTENTSKLVGRSEWRKFIKENETFLLKPYYEGIKRFINDGHNSAYLIREYQYGY